MSTLTLSAKTLATARTEIARRHDCHLDEIVLVLSGPRGQRRATVAFPGGEWRSRVHLDDLSAVTEAQLTA